jgi:hypothetical protein
MVRVIDVPEEPDFDSMCEIYDIPVFDRGYLRLIWEDSGWDACYRQFKLTPSRSD